MADALPSYNESNLSAQRKLVQGTSLNSAIWMVIDPWFWWLIFLYTLHYVIYSFHIKKQYFLLYHS